MSALTFFFFFGNLPVLSSSLTSCFPRFTQNHGFLKKTSLKGDFWSKNGWKNISALLFFVTTYRQLYLYVLADLIKTKDFQKIETLRAIFGLKATSALIGVALFYNLSKIQSRSADKLHGYAFL